MNFPIVSFFEAVRCAWLVYVCEKETAFLDQKTALCLIAAERLRSRADHQEAVLLPISWYKLWWKWWKAAVLTLKMGHPTRDLCGCYFFLVILLNPLPQIRIQISWDVYLLHFLKHCLSSEDLHLLDLWLWGRITSSECIYDFLYAYIMPAFIHFPAHPTNNDMIWPNFFLNKATCA